MEAAMKTRFFWSTLVLLSALALASACTDPLWEDDWDGTGPGPTPDSGQAYADTSGLCTDPNGDYDSDGIPNGDEGCLSGRDSDGDKIPDWQDLDSDNDKVPDNVEKGTKASTGKCAGGTPPKDKWPCDSDGDQLPDYLDKDSDGDGLMDGAEDANGDGLVGCCLAKCKTPGSYQQQKCKLVTSTPAKPTDGCGAGQQCVKGSCVPSLAFQCSEGETSTKKKDTFGDGKLDNERGTFICRDATEDKPIGRKPVLYKTSDTAKGDWHVAMEKSAKYGEMGIASAPKKMVAAAIDHENLAEEVAGFILSKDCTQAKIQDVLTSLIGSVQSIGGTVTQRASGVQGKSHDKYDTVQGTILDIKVSSASNVSTLRNELVAKFLGQQMSSMSNLPQPFGTSTSEFVVKFSTVKRVAFQKDSKGNLVKDSKGYPMDSGDKTKWRTIVIGAVASKTNDMDPKRKTGFIVEDLSNGTAVAIYTDKVGDECDVGTITSLPIADIIWVIDESGSMNDNRKDIVNNANNFFSRALSSGLDFRMGVTNVCNPSGSYKAAVGKFCSKISTTSSDMGGTDRFLLPSEQTIFSSCINNPPGYEGSSEYGLVNAKEAVKKHLPRATGATDKIRPQATLVIIVATDEFPQSMSSTIGSSNSKTCTLPASNQTAVDTAVLPYLSLFSGITDPEATAMFHVIGGVCNNTCNAYVAHGYKELAQKLSGQWADVCQKNLGNTLQVIIDTITGAASPVVLEYVPISASLAVAMDAVAISRSRTNGFDFRSASNSLVFINVKYKKGSEVIASYKRWEGQTIIK